MDRQRVVQISERSKADKWPFPRTFEALKEAEVASYRFDVPTGETLFKASDGSTLVEPLPGVSRVTIAPALDGAAVAAAIQRHTIERTPFLEFRRDAALAGVQSWEVDMRSRTCTYYGLDGGMHVEPVPPFKA